MTVDALVIAYCMVVMVLFALCVLLCLYFCVCCKLCVVCCVSWSVFVVYVSWSGHIDERRERMIIYYYLLCINIYIYFASMVHI